MTAHVVPDGRARFRKVDLPVGVVVLTSVELEPGERREDARHGLRVDYPVVRPSHPVLVDHGFRAVYLDSSKWDAHGGRHWLESQTFEMSDETDPAVDSSSQIGRVAKQSG